MRQRVIFVICIMQLLVLTGCKENINNHNEVNSITQTIEVSTGYVDGEIQWSYVMVNDKVYESITKTIYELPEGYTEIGKVSRNLTDKMPSYNYEGVHIPVESLIYGKDDDKTQVILKIGENKNGFQIYEQISE